MIGADKDGVFVGTFVGFRKINPLSTKITALFKGDDRMIGVPVDYRQQAFIQKEHVIGSKVALGYYGGEWHIGSKPIQPDVCLKAPVVY